MLRAAGAEHAQLAPAIDDVEASVRVAELAPASTAARPRKGSQSPARVPAMEAGVSDIWRETLASSLEVAEAALVALGTPRDAAASQVQFARTTKRRSAPRLPSKTTRPS